MTIGNEMYALVSELFPLPRSLTGDGVRETLRIIKQHIPIETYEVPSGTKVFDWTVPDEWNVIDAALFEFSTGVCRRAIDFRKNNLHVVGYSEPVSLELTLSELQPHLHSLADIPDAIPYVTSYYQNRWGFCLTHNEHERLKDGKYVAYIHSTLDPDGSLTYAELVIPGELPETVLLSTYICHPSMANNELSGPVVATYLAKWLMSEPRRYTYRIAFVPETIGALAYLHEDRGEKCWTVFGEMFKRRWHHLQDTVIAGYVVTCVGDDRAYSYLPSRYGNTLADRAALLVLEHRHPTFMFYSYLDRGSDESQYCAPGIDLPVCSVMRSKYGTYPEYHTSLDDLSLVSPSGLQGAYDVYKDILTLIERNRVYKVSTVGEPFLSKHGLYPTLSTRDSTITVQAMMDFLAYADGTNDLIEICHIINRPPWELYGTIDKLLEAQVISVI
jgi:aminopeptidase-like protein